MRTSLVPPPSFHRLEQGDRIVVVDDAFRDAARGLGLLDAGGLARLLARNATDADPSTPNAHELHGRGPLALVPLGSAGELLCLRTLRRGGWLARWLPTRPTSLSRPLSELAVTAELRAAGAPVPRPILVAAERNGRRYDTVVGTLYESDTVDGLAFLAANPGPARVLRMVAAAGIAVRRFHDAGGRHPDLHLKNLLVRERPAGVDVLVIDLDRARRQPEVSPRARVAELMRLWRSVVKRGHATTVGPRGRARFFGAYVAGDRALRRALRAGLGRERLRLALHTLHYRRA